jgi:hypothetical protein
LSGRAPEPPAPRSGRRDAIAVTASALLLLLGLSVVREPKPDAPPAASVEGSLAMPPLPSGAPPRDPEAPLADDGGQGCHFADRGFGDYERWRPAGAARVLVPQGGGLADDGSFQLLVHFHGAEPVRKQLAPEGLDVVIAAMDTGVASGAYRKAFQDPTAFPRLVASVETAVAAARATPAARAGSVFVSAWSAGYGAIGPILAAKQPAVDAVVLLDALHASYQVGTREVDRAGLGVFVDFARSAAAGGPFFFLSHTKVPTGKYASTEEVASFLETELGIRFEPVAPAGDPFGLFRMVARGGLQMRGFLGDGREAHCAQLRLLKDVLRDHVLPLGRRADRATPAP